MDEQSEAIGFLGSDGVLYCSNACAFRERRMAGCEVDQDEYESLVEGEPLRAGTVCSGCGVEFAVSWPECEPS